MNGREVECASSETGVRPGETSEMAPNHSGGWDITCGWKRGNSGFERGWNSCSYRHWVGALTFRRGGGFFFGGGGDGGPLCALGCGIDTWARLDRGGGPSRGGGRPVMMIAIVGTARFGLGNYR